MEKKGKYILNVTTGSVLCIAEPRFHFMGIDLTFLGQGLSSELKLIKQTHDRKQLSKNDSHPTQSTITLWSFVESAFPFPLRYQWLLHTAI